VGVDVGPGVLGLAGSEEDVRDELVELADELEELVVGEVLERELALGGVTGVGLAEDGVTVTRDDLTTVESLPDELLDGLVRSVLADLGLHARDPVEDLLVSKTEGRGEAARVS
jgi:hypothetical protein